MAQSAERQPAGKSGGRAKATAAADRNGRAETGNGIAQNMTDLDFLRGLIEAVDQSGIDTLEINRAGTRIRIAKTPATAASYHALPAVAAPPPAMLAAAPAATAAPPAAGAAAAPEPAPAAPAQSHLIDVKSPMVGTFYRAPAPDAPPYVELGSTVGKGQTLCILEAMKLMNELESELDGVVREVLVEDADPVEFGQVLFRIEPAGSK
jgi:acetyl-CoA carboxylase biotin carboxyl carrier protein